MQKTILLFLCLLLIVTTADAQTRGFWGTGFDRAQDSVERHLVIDTFHYKRNIWQVGRPQKAVCTSAKTPPNTIVTDTLHPYPPNDTSVFIIKNNAPYVPNYGAMPMLWFDYWLDKDSGDVAMLEYSIDTGKTWTNVNDNPFKVPNDTVRLDTNTTGWVQVKITLNAPTDSFFYRFTFISDSVDNPHDGWIIDNIYFDGYWEGIAGLQKDNTFISIYPNPCTNDLYIKSKRIAVHTPQVSIYDALGRQLYNAPLTTDHIPIDLPNGTYVLRYTTDDAVAQKMFVVHE